MQAPGSSGEPTCERSSPGLETAESSIRKAEEDKKLIEMSSTDVLRFLFKQLHRKTHERIRTVPHLLLGLVFSLMFHLALRSAASDEPQEGRAKSIHH